MTKKPHDDRPPTPVRAPPPPKAWPQGNDRPIPPEQGNNVLRDAVRDSMERTTPARRKRKGDTWGAVGAVLAFLALLVLVLVSFTSGAAIGLGAP